MSSNGHTKKEYPVSERGLQDAGEDRDRIPPCVKQTWCTLLEGHAGDCIEKPRTVMPRQAWDLKTPDPRGWGRGRKP